MIQVENKQGNIGLETYFWPTGPIRHIEHTIQ